MGKQRFSKKFVLSRLFLLTLLVSLAIAVAMPALTQVSTPKTREELLQQVRENAALDLDVDKMDVESAIKDFKGNAFGVTEREIRETYKKEFKRLKEAKENDIWEKLPKEFLGLIVVVVIVIYEVLKKILEEKLTNTLKIIIDWFYQQFAGSPFLLQFTLKRYQQALIKKYRDLKIPFRPGRPLPMREVYVPLKVAGSGVVANIEAFEAVKTHRRLMVTGAPGSGKSMLLKSLMLAYAEDRLFSQKEDVTPILLELNRLSDSTLSIEQHLVEALGRDDFLKATWFVKQGLKNGSLMLLLDGLDELNSNDRPQAVTRIKTFLDKEGEKCRVIITCRTQVYNQEFNQEADQILEIVEFSDQQIRRFLGAWKLEMPPDKSIEQLIQALRERPRIMALARNPLLLTIIAYLYTDTTFILPHSRSEFYQQATDILLEKWDQSKQQPNQYRGRDKRQVLQVLALYNQDSTNQQSQDRRSIDYLVALEQVKSVLPRLNLPEENAEAILNEIVERSGLLLAIDGGQRYQFSHLTLQEFFAAAALVQRSEELVIRFEKDRDAWREVVKLWCGLADQSTELIRAIYAIEPITAFECLADANSVAPDLADQIIEDFKIQLYQETNESTILAAFASVASSNRPDSRGEKIFQYFKDNLLNSQEYSPILTHTLNVLVNTNSPKSVDVLAQHYLNVINPNHPLGKSIAFDSAPFSHNAYAFAITDAFYFMGDLAVPQLVNFAQQGNPLMLYCLKRIETSNSALALVDFLWNPNEVLANRAAWHLAEIVSQSEIEGALREYPLTEQQKKADYLDWVWSPFQEPVNSALPIIMGRVAHLINQTPDDKISIPYTTIIDPHQRMLDPRLITPLCAIENFPLEELNAQWDKTADPLLEQRENSAELDQMIVENINEMLKNINSRWRLFLPYLTPRLQLDLLHRLLIYRRPVPRDWVNLFKQLKYEFQTSWHYHTIEIFSFFLFIISIIEMVSVINGQPANILNWLLSIPIYILSVFWLLLYEISFNHRLFLSFGVFGIVDFWQKLGQLYRSDSVWINIQSLIKAVFIVGSMFIILFMFKILPPPIGVAILSVFGGTVPIIIGTQIKKAISNVGASKAFQESYLKSYSESANKANKILKESGVDTSPEEVQLRLKKWHDFIDIAQTWIWSGLIAVPLFIAIGVGPISVIGVLMGIGLGVWERAIYKQDRFKYLAILAFPWFCTFPIVFIFSSLAMHDFLSWQWPQILIAWIVIFSTCTALWQRGQKLDHDARNPLYGILDKQ